MTPEEQHQEFINGIARLLSARPQAGVMLLIASPSGLEVLSSSSDFVFQFGLLRAADETLTTRYREQSRSVAASGEREAREAMTAMDLGEKPKGGMN